MKTTDEIRMGNQRESAEALIKTTHGDKALDIVFSYSHLECFVDVKLEEGWIRYVVIEDDEDNTLRRIG